MFAVGASKIYGSAPGHVLMSVTRTKILLPFSCSQCRRSRHDLGYVTGMAVTLPMSAVSFAV